MSNPDNAAAQVTGQTGTSSIEQQVNDIVSKATVGEDGNLVLPADLKVSEEVLYAAKLEKRRRDTQSALSKTSQQLAAEETMRKELEKRVAAQVKITMSNEEAEELESLKYDDPEAWRQRMNQLEQKATTSVQEELSNISTQASQQAELNRRAQVLHEFNLAAQVAITDEVLANDIPPRIVNKLEKGTITFEEFLTEAHDYLVTPKKVGSPKLSAQPNLGSAGGSSDASDAAKAVHAQASYKNTIF